MIGRVDTSAAEAQAQLRDTKVDGAAGDRLGINLMADTSAPARVSAGRDGLARTWCAHFPAWEYRIGSRRR